MGKYLITGITGFAGPHLAKLLLAEGQEVDGLIRCGNGRQLDLLDVLTADEIEVIGWRICDLKHEDGIRRIVRDGKYAGIFHLAAQSHPPTSFADPILTFAENVTGSVNLIAALDGMPTRLMFCSTSEVYGTTCIGKPLPESTPLAPSNPYGCSKAAIDLYVQERTRNGKLDAFITRAFSHTGPRRGKCFSLSSDAYQIARIEAGLQEPTLRVGNLDSQRAVMDVRDTVRAYWQLMQIQTSSGRAYNVASTDVRPIGWYVREMVGMSPEKKRIKLEPDPKLIRPIDIHVQVADVHLVRSAIGWKPEIPIWDTLLDLLDYWRRRISQAVAA